ncbi:hypothetical protein I597_1385 [Dokdonia donghaensis DSW-1]|nr:hypothetical protein I597_1385 [Dokdonia donghaensis DSW-1]
MEGELTDAQILKYPLVGFKLKAIGYKLVILLWR